MINSKDIKHSALSVTGKYSLSELQKWYYDLLSSTEVKIDKVDLNELIDWDITDLGQIKHESGKFFSVDGYEIRLQDPANCTTWQQPAINQNEIGILGFLCCRIAGVLHFLVQAKVEPGNINYLQLSPTVQATRSNYTKVHRGENVKFLSYFFDNNALIDRLQTEQGGRFFRKLNRNVIVHTNDNITEPANFRWMTLAQIDHFLKSDNKVNMDTRTVLSHLSSIGQKYVDLQLELNFLNNQRFVNHVEISPKSLYDLTDWRLIEGEITRPDEKYFKIIGASVQIDGREVSSWSQPMIKPSKVGICGLLIREVENEIQVLVQAKFEFGLVNKVEFSPTVQSLIGGRQLAVNNLIPFIDYFTSEKKNVEVIYKGMQSEEGGRFFQEENQNQILKVDDTFDHDQKRFRWVEFSKLSSMASMGCIANIQLRNLLLILWFYQLKK